jgi:hypothetical protein
MQSDGSSTAIWRISARFFSPPEKPTLTGRLSMSCETFSFAARSLTWRMNSGALISFSPRALRWAFKRHLEELHGGDTGNLDRILEGQEHTLGGALVRFHFKEVFALEGDGAFRHFIALAPGEDIGQRRFAGTVRPHDGVHFARLHGESVSPLRISRDSSSSLTWRLLISSMIDPGSGWSGMT